MTTMAHQEDRVPALVLPFLGLMFKTVSCIANMAADIGNTFAKVAQGAISIQVATRLSAFKAAGIIGAIETLAKPHRTARPTDQSPSTLAESRKITVPLTLPQSSQMSSSSYPARSRSIGSWTSSTVLSTSSLSKACLLPTASDLPYLEKFYAENAACSRGGFCSAECEACLREDDIESLDSAFASKLSR